MRLRFLWLGKTKNPSIRSLLSDYEDRTRHLVACEIVEGRDPSKARQLREVDRIAVEGIELMRAVNGTPRLVALDERGKQFSSAEFARWFENEQNRGTREIVFMIGGADGLSPEVSRRADMTLSLGRMTWTHEMCRVLLLEQVYRAFSIVKNIPYHK
jgi:23S rRNA (pseudouridine1915-N3)-methyltransferase